VRELERLSTERAMPQVVVSDNGLSKKAMAREEYTSAMARRASNFGYDSAKPEGTVRQRGSLRAAHRQGFARAARRLTPPLTGAAAAAEESINGS